MLLEQARQHALAYDQHFFFCGVPCDADLHHEVAQVARHAEEVLRRSHEQHFAQVERQMNVAIDERLARIPLEDFFHRFDRIAFDFAQADLIHFLQHEHGSRTPTARSAAAILLGCAPWRVRRVPTICASPRPPISESGERPAQPARESGHKRRFADLGRTDNAGNRSTQIPAQLGDGEVVEQALLLLDEADQFVVEFGAHSLQIDAGRARL